jgi:hypothetical protein
LSILIILAEEYQLCFFKLPVILSLLVPNILPSSLSSNTLRRILCSKHGYDSKYSPRKKHTRHVILQIQKSINTSMNHATCNCNTLLNRGEWDPAV